MGSGDSEEGWGYVVQSLHCNHYIHEWTCHSAGPVLLPAQLQDDAFYFELRCGNFLIDYSLQSIHFTVCVGINI